MEITSFSTIPRTPSPFHPLQERALAHSAMLRNLRAMLSTTPKKVSLRQRQAHWKAAAPAPLPGSTTFAAQSSLPHLPVPELAGTLSQLKESLKPLAWSSEEYSAAIQKIDDFENGLAPKLHQRLLDRAASTEQWLEEWWDVLGYLSYRYVKWSDR